MKHILASPGASLVRKNPSLLEKKEFCRWNSLEGMKTESEATRETLESCHCSMILQGHVIHVYLA